MVKFFYPSSKGYSMLSSFAAATLDVKNTFPRCSISLYDDVDFQRLRQSYMGKQIVSNICSDEFFPYATSSEKQSYLIGSGDSYRVFYVKVVVHQHVASDVVGQSSSFFTLASTTTFGGYRTVYSPLVCLDKAQYGTVYRGVVAFYASDFVNNFDGEVFLTLVGEFSVELEVPLNIAVENAVFAPISQTASATPKIVSAVPNFLQYFQTVDVSILYADKSDDLNYDFVPFDFPASQSLFSTAPVIFSAGSIGTLARLSFNEGIVESSLKYFAVTLTNAEAGYNPEIDTSFSLVLRNKFGKIYRKDACRILNNVASGYYNVLFQLSDLDFSEEYVDYVMLELRSLNSNITQPYQVTFMSFLDTASDEYNVFTIAPMAVGDGGHFSIDVFGNAVTIDEVKSDMPLQSLGDVVFSDSVLVFTDSSPIQIYTESHSAVLPESAFVFSESDPLSIFSLKKGDKIRTVSGLEEIQRILVRPTKQFKVLDLTDLGYYAYDGIFMKNPPIIKNYKRTLLGKKLARKKTNRFVEINGQKYVLYAAPYGYTYRFESKVDAKRVAKIDTNFAAQKIAVQIECETSVAKIEPGKKRSLPLRDKLLVFDLNGTNAKFELRSESDILIKAVFILK